MPKQMDRMQVALETRRKHSGREYEEKLLDDSEPAQFLSRLGMERTYGDAWSRPGLDMRSRSFLTMGMLAVMGLENQFKSHLRNAHHIGITKNEIIEMLIHIHGYLGTPRSGNLTTWANDLWPVIGADKQPKKKKK